jgi:hypothetical protein
MKAPETVLEELLRQVRVFLYSGLPDHSWFTQQARCKATLTFPGAWLDERKVELSSERYQQIMQAILVTIKEHCPNPRQLGPFPCAYLHRCVELHMQHHGDEYYQEGKSVRNALDRAMATTTRARISAVAVFAATHRATQASLAVGKRKPKVKPASQESDLLL